MAALLRTLALTCAILGASVSVAAAQPAPLPPNPYDLLRPSWDADGLTRALAQGEAAAERCRVSGGDLSCTCVRGPDSDADEWAVGDVRGIARRSPAGDTVSYVGSALEIDGAWVLEDVRIVVGDVLVRAAHAHLRPEEVTLDSVVWHHRGGQTAGGCAARPEPAAKFARAARAAWSPQTGWTLGRFHAHGLAIPLARGAHRSAFGLLPGTLRANADGVDGEIAAAIAQGTFAFASAGTAAPALFGIGLAARRRAAAAAPLRLGIAASRDAAAPVAYGDFGVGTSTHLRVHLEHPVDETTWGRRRLESGALWRDWRASQVGLSAAGDGHALQIGGTVHTSPELPQAQWTGSLSFGFDVRAGRHAEWTLDVVHQSDALLDTRHSSTAALGFRAPFGAAERVWVRPGVDLLANFAAVTVARGFDASTTLTALGTVEAGGALVGVHGDARHRVSPVLRAGAEIAGTQQRQEREGAPPYPFERPRAWRWVQTTLEQSWRHGAVRLEAPIGAFADFREAGTTLNAFARASAVIGTARVDAGVVCRGGCDEPGFLTRGRLTPWRGASVEYAVAELTEVELAHLLGDQLTANGLTLLRLWQPDSAAAGTAHRAGLRFARRQFWGALEGRLGGGAAARGGAAEIGWHSPVLGWGVCAAAGAAQTGDWGVVAGLRLAR